ncbi:MULTISPECIES: fimbrial protein [unclassified Pseudocitrobacter]|uniref:fimbrial protein n=1 Tax=unclassified Pseudocitrobacter TaxID=2638778 RepID=UPI0023E3A832|nr:MULTISPECIES: fimbrial protein [unclassified Pseudocitrobacter]MDF3829730.1 fimbrial protein [Pseudocitrobacter sp. 2023EL-00150]MEC5376040.1 fimbrial protein [Pseudocitrobacter sp. MW920760]
MNILNYISGLALFFSWLPLGYAANDGTCATRGGTHTLSLNFPLTTVSSQNNVPGKTLMDIANATSAESYSVLCNCDLAHSNGAYHEIFYTADPAPGMVYDQTISGLSFYNLNQYVNVGSKISVLNAGYNGVPFEHVSNKTTTTNHTCGGSKTTAVGVNLTTGTNARVSFNIKRSINGTVVIPMTDIALLYANISSTTTRGEPIAKVRISGSLTAPQSCQINAGQVVNFDFNTIPASAFSSTVGQAITSRKITKTVNIECTGMGDASTQGLDVSFTGTNRSSDDTMVATDNTDVGIKVYNKSNVEISTNNGKLPADMESTSVSGHKNGSVTFSAAPASLTGARPQPGVFNATATLTIEFIN